MNLGTLNLNNLISKDNKVSIAAAERIVNDCDIESFEKLSEKSEFLFDFLKEKIITNLINAVNSSNISNTFKFIKIYNSEFEDFIIKAWVKFADEDLTDKILEIFENGTDEERTYAAAYFCSINDTLSLEFLNKYAFSEYEPLAQNCARALKQFNDKEIFNNALKVIKDDTVDDFEKYKYVNFLVSYGDKTVFDDLYNYFEKSFTKGFVSSSILYLKSFYEMTEQNEEDKALKIFDIILTSYPEEISLDTVLDFEIFDFVRFLAGQIEAKNPDINASYIKRLILKAKYKFNLIAREDIYTYDLAKNVKKEINEISAFLNTLNVDLFKGLEIELLSDDKERVLEALDVILNYGKVEFLSNIKEVVEKTEYEDVIADCIKVLKVFNGLCLVSKDEILNKLKNNNIKALVLGMFS